MDSPIDSGTYQLATFVNRLAAFLIDDFILTIISFFLSFLVGAFINTFIEAFIVGVLIRTAYYGYFWTQRLGQSPGKQVMNIRIVKSNGDPLTLTDVAIRVMGYYVGFITLFIGFIWASFDAKSQAWHDKMADTYVVVANPEKRKTINI